MHIVAGVQSEMNGLGWRGQGQLFFTENNATRPLGTLSKRGLWLFEQAGVQKPCAERKTPNNLAISYIFTMYWTWKWHQFMILVTIFYGYCRNLLSQRLIDLILVVHESSKPGLQRPAFQNRMREDRRRKKKSPWSSGALSLRSLISDYRFIRTEHCQH